MDQCYSSEMGLRGMGRKSKGEVSNKHSLVNPPPPPDFKQIDQALKPGRDQFGLNQQASSRKWTERKEEAERWLKNGEERSISFAGRTDGWVDP